MQPPDISNLTVPGGLKVFFDDGSGMRDLGYMTGLDVAPKTDEFKHESNRSGKRRVVKTFTVKEELEFKFTLHEPVINNMLLFFKGGTVETVGAGTDTETDQKVTLAGSLLASVGQYGISAVTARQFVDACLKYDGAAYIDNSLEADISGGAAFLALEDALDYFYVGKATQFKELYFDLSVPGDYGAGLTWEYWNGSTWSAIVGKAGAGQDLEADGALLVRTGSGALDRRVSAP